MTGRVVGISDGDTLTVLVERRQVKVRLADIDAPELKQAFGTRSRQSLAALCFNREVRLETAGTDRNGRTIATVHCAGTDANAEQVRQGMAVRAVCPPGFAALRHPGRGAGHGARLVGRSAARGAVGVAAAWEKRARSK